MMGICLYTYHIKGVDQIMFESQESWDVVQEIDGKLMGL